MRQIHRSHVRLRQLPAVQQSTNGPARTAGHSASAEEENGSKTAAKPSLLPIRNL